MKRLLREPLFHFLILGALIFAVFKFTSRGEASEPGTIVVTQGQIESLVTGFTRTWQRPPTQTELDGLINEFVREEVCAREAIALGLDKDDTIIRRRLRQKLEFISESVATQAVPTEEQLRKYFEAHADKFRGEHRFTFTQVYLDPQRHGANLSRKTALMLAQLHQAGSKGAVSLLGDSRLLEPTFAELPTSEVSKQFGEKFAAKLGELPVGQWQGPIESGYGVHLVFINSRIEGRLPALAEVRDAVQREWANTQRLETNEKVYQALLKRYRVTIEQPQLAAAANPN